MVTTSSLSSFFIFLSLLLRVSFAAELWCNANTLIHALSEDASNHNEELRLKLELPAPKSKQNPDPMSFIMTKLKEIRADNKECFTQAGVAVDAKNRPFKFFDLRMNKTGRKESIVIKFVSKASEMNKAIQNSKRKATGKNKASDQWYIAILTKTPKNCQAINNWRQNIKNAPLECPAEWQPADGIPVELPVWLTVADKKGKTSYAFRAWVLTVTPGNTTTSRPGVFYVAVHVKTDPAETLGDYVYRWDDRKLATLAQGFQPWKPTGTLPVITHVKNAYDDGKLSKHDSQWVSTMDYRAVKTIDATFAQKLFDTNLYKIDVNLAQATGAFVNANQAFRDQRLKSPYEGQAEFAKLGGVPLNAIVGSMTGKEYFEQTDQKMPPTAPNENGLKFS